MMKEAIIVSNNIKHCIDYCYFKRLNRNDYYLVDDIYRLHGLSPNIPVIITHCSAPLDDSMAAMLKYRFTNVTLENY